MAKDFKQLKEELLKQKDELASKVSKETMNIIDKGIEELQKAGAGMKSPKKGDKAPDFTLPNATGKEITLSQELKKGPVVLKFYRGSWCPFCNLELRALQLALPQIKEMGANLIAISPEIPDNSLSLVEKHSLGFEVLSDYQSEVAEKYNLTFNLGEKVNKVYKDLGIDLEQANNVQGDKLPIPATFVVNECGEIEYAFVEADYSKRAEPADILQAIKKVKSKAQC